MSRRRALLLGGKLRYLSSFKTASDSPKFLFPYRTNTNRYYKVVFPSGAEVFTRSSYIDMSIEEGEKEVFLYYVIYYGSIGYLNVNDFWARVLDSDKSILANYYDVDESEVLTGSQSRTYIPFNPLLTEIDSSRILGGSRSIINQKIKEFDLRNLNSGLSSLTIQSNSPLVGRTLIYLSSNTQMSLLELRGTSVEFIEDSPNNIKRLNIQQTSFVNGFADLSGFHALERVEALQPFTHYFTKIDISNSLNIKHIEFYNERNYEIILPTQFYSADFINVFPTKDSADPEETLRFYGEVTQVFVRGDRYKAELIIDYPLAVERLGTTSRAVANITSMTNLTFLLITSDFQTITDMSLLPSSVLELRINGEGGHDYSDNSNIVNLRHTNLTRASTDLSGMSSLQSVYISFPNVETTIIIPPTTNVVNYINISVESTTTSGGSNQSILDTLDLALDSTITNGTYRWAGGAFNGGAFPQDVKDKVDLLITKGWDTKIERGGGGSNPKRVYP